MPEIDATLGVLVPANFGTSHELRVDGVPVGEALGSGFECPDAAGSCIAIAVTDAPLGTAQLTRIAHRCGLGLARIGSAPRHGSGEIFLALSTGVRRPRIDDARRETLELVPDDRLDQLFHATVEATEEAVLTPCGPPRT